MKLALATDHAGYVACKEISSYLTALGHDCIDFGPQKFNADDDYPDFITPAAQAVSQGVCDMGIILGGSGQGEAMAANRVKGVRATVFYGPALAKTAVDAAGHSSDDPHEIIKLSRAHNDANVLSLAGRFLSLDEMKHAVELWLATPFSGASRHSRRIKKLG